MADHLHVSILEHCIGEGRGEEGEKDEGMVRVK